MRPLRAPLAFVIVTTGLPFPAACAQKALVASPTAPAQSAYSAPTIKPSEPMTAAELDQVRQQLAGCWYLNPQNTAAPIPAVEIKAELLPDGTVTSAQVVNSRRTQSDPAFRDAAEAAERAILKCHQLKLPRDKYDSWKSIMFIFNPQGVM